MREILKVHKLTNALQTEGSKENNHRGLYVIQNKQRKQTSKYIKQQAKYITGRDAWISRFSDYVAPAGALSKLDLKYLQAFNSIWLLNTPILI